MSGAPLAGGAAAGIPVPVVVTIGPLVAGSRPVRLAAAEPLVAATPFLGWRAVAAAAGVARVELFEWQMLEAFSRKARGAPDGPSKAALALRSLLTLHLAAAWWSTYLSELIASGLLGGTMRTRKELHRRLKALQPVNPARLLVASRDWSAAEDFDTPGRAVPTAGPADLKFLDLAKLSLLEDGADGAEPWAAVARGSGMLGAAATRAIRLQPIAPLRTTAVLLRAAVSHYVGLEVAAVNDAAVAASLGEFLRSPMLPAGLEAHGVSGPELISEATDSFRYRRSRDERPFIEESRLHLLEFDAPRLHSSIIAASGGDNSHAYPAMCRLVALFGGSDIESPCRQLSRIEEGLQLRSQQVYDAANKPQADGSSIVGALEAAEHLAKAPAEVAGGQLAGPQESPMPSSDALTKVCRSAPFIKVKREVEALNLTTSAGRINALGSGFDGRCPLTVRQLMEGSETLARRDPLLEALRRLRPFIPEYLQYAFTVDPSQGSVPQHLAKFSLSPARSECELTARMLRYGVHEVNWVDAPFGLCGMRAWRAATAFAQWEAVNPADHYCQPQLLDELGPFMHTAMVAFGAADVSTEGFTMRAWVARYARHVRRATGLTTVHQQLRWLIRADEWFRASLRLISTLWRAAIHSTDPAGTQYAYVLPFDCSMAMWMDGSEKALDERQQLRSFEWHPLHSIDAATARDAYSLPLLSSTPAEFDQQPVKRQCVSQLRPQADRTCGLCQRVFSSRNALMKHLHEVHNVASASRREHSGRGGNGAAIRRAARRASLQVG